MQYVRIDLLGCTYFHWMTPGASRVSTLDSWLGLAGARWPPVGVSGDQYFIFASFDGEVWVR